MTAQPPPLRAFTLHRPWARCVVEWGKALENRSWPAPASMIGRHMAIHAGKTWDDSGATMIRRLRPNAPLDGGSHPAGVIVGIVRVVGCVSVGTTGIVSKISGEYGGIPWEEREPWCFGPYGWLLAEIVAIEPVPCRGAQGLWAVPPDVLPIVRERWRVARAA